MSDFDLQSIQQFQGVGTVFHEPSMASTSDVAKAKLNKNGAIELPLLVLCDRQTAGRGQLGKTWNSDAQSLTFTWCVAVEAVPVSNQELIPLIAGASICEAIESVGIEGAKLKWPNDVLINRRKVCGILVEKISSLAKSFYLIGVGVNVNQTDSEIESFDCSDSRFPPGSLSCLKGTNIEIQKLLAAAVHCLETNVFNERDWQHDLNARFSFLDQQIKIQKPGGEIVEGIFRGVDKIGRLTIESNGELKVVTSGQIQ